MKIVVFSGAGISRESGLKTFRDSEDGLWNGYDVMRVASPQGWREDPGTVLEFYNMRRAEIREAKPNPAHYALAELENSHEVIVITQNIDDLHERAGSTNVVHLHGEIFKARPENDEYRWVEWREDMRLGDRDERGVQLRPAIVWFGEGLPEMDRAMELALGDDVDVLIVVGTTLNVYPAALIATETKASQVFVVDPTPPALRVPGVRYIVQPASIGVPEAIRSLGSPP